MLLKQPPSLPTCPARTSRTPRCGVVVRAAASDGTPPPPTRRAALAAASVVLLTRPALAADPTPSDVVYLDVGLCSEGYRNDRALGDATALCTSPAPLGRITLGLYGDTAPGTTAQFLALIKQGDLNSTLFHKVVPGQYIAGGRTGARRMGELSPTPPLPSNPDILSPSAFTGTHSRPGTLSLALGESDDDDSLRLAPGYRAAQFLITTGPGPVPRLDGANIVFGRVLYGLDVVTAVTRVPTLRAPPGPWTAVARLLGDERAARVASKYGRPLKLVVITGAGVVDGKK